MTRTIKLAVAAAMALGATSAFATNGDHLIGLGAKARGMGGVGIGMSHGAESGLANPAMITSVDGTEISFGGTIFMPKVKYDGGAGYQDSDADFNMIPEVSIANEAIDNFFYWGIGMWGTAGMGVDYRTTDTNTDATMQMVTNLQLMQFGVPLSVKISGLSLGVTPIVQYGSLDINYVMPTSFGGGSVGAGVAQDFGFGFNVGASYDFADVGVKGLTVGAVYKSEIEMEYDQQLTSATAPFVTFGFLNDGDIGDKLSQPAEIGVGVSYTYEGSTLAFDYKQIKWGSAKGYEDFGWDDQNVYAIGYQFAMDNWAVRAGFNYAEQPIDEADGTTPSGAVMNMFNLLGFPATVEQHYSIGGTYAFTKVISVDAGFTYAPETETEFDTTALFGPGSTANVKHHQYGISIQGNYAF